MAQRGYFQYAKLKVQAWLLRALFGGIAWNVTREQLPMTKDIKREKVRIPSRNQGRFINGYLYYPPNYNESMGSLPGVVNWHGSGFVASMLDSDCYWCAQVARELGVFVLDMDYRKAPEDPFPAAVYDVEDALQHVATQPARFDAKRIAVSGFSAGATLALVASSVLSKGLDGISIPAVVAFYPVADLSLNPASRSVPKPNFALPAVVMRAFMECLCPDPKDLKDPRVSPAYADVALFPNTVVIITCGGDVLAPEGDELAKKLEGGERKVVHKCFEGTPHGFDKQPKITKYWEMKEEAYKMSIDALRVVLGPRTGTMEHL